MAAPIEVRIVCRVVLAREAERYACCRIIMNAAMSATMTATMGSVVCGSTLGITPLEPVPESLGRSRSISPGPPGRLNSD